MQAHGITHLVTKNAGGAGTAKLDAADRLGLTTIVIDRPPLPRADIAATVDAAIDWLTRLGIPDGGATCGAGSP